MDALYNKIKVDPTEEFNRYPLFSYKNCPIWLIKNDTFEDMSVRLFFHLGQFEQKS